MRPHPRITVVGLGYVGCVTAACLSKQGFFVVGADRDGHKVSSVLAGQSSFYEPGLAELGRGGVEGGRVSPSTQLARALAGKARGLGGLGRASALNGNPDLGQIERVIHGI